MLTTLLAMDDGEVTGLAIIVGGCIIIAVAHSIRRVFEARARETTRREVAAYVAEGAIKPEDAARLLMAGDSTEKEKMLAEAVAIGRIEPQEAAKLM